MTKYQKLHKQLLKEFHDIFDGSKTTDFNGKAKPYVLESRKLLAKDRHYDGNESLSQFLVDSQMIQLSEQWLKFVSKHFDDFMKGDSNNG